MRNRRSSGPGKRTVLLFCALAAVLGIWLAACSGSTLSHPELTAFRQKVCEKYPRAKVSCQYQYGKNVSITVKLPSCDEETACTVLGYLQPAVSSEGFINALFALAEEKSNGDPNWELGRRPEIWLYLDVKGSSRYQFTAGANREVYNSGNDPDSYTWDGYTTWYGTEFSESGSREIPMEELNEKLKDLRE